MMPTFYIIKRGGGKSRIGGTRETQQRIERTRGVELFCLDHQKTSDATRDTQNKRTNKQTKKKKNKKKKDDVKKRTTTRERCF